MPWSLLLNPTVLLVIALALAIGTVGIQTKRLDSAQARIQAITADFDTYKARVAAEGRAAQERADKQAKEDKQRQVEADNESKKRYASLDAQYATYRLRVRSGSNSTSILSAAHANTSGDNSICYTRIQLDNEITSAVGRLRAGIADDSEPYDRATEVARTCRKWALKE